MEALRDQLSAELRQERENKEREKKEKIEEMKKLISQDLEGEEKRLRNEKLREIGELKMKVNNIPAINLSTSNWHIILAIDFIIKCWMHSKKKLILEPLNI